MLERSGLAGDAVDRLTRYASRHLPLEESSEGSPFIPPFYALRVAEHLQVQRGIAIEFAAAGCLFFAAADIADDCADGDVRRTVGLDVNDTCHLLFAQQQATLTLDLPIEMRAHLALLFADAGQEMAIGQAADLIGTGAQVAVDPMQIALGKTGGELAAFFAGPAMLAGADPDAWRSFGRAFGALVQILTDYFDIFLDPQSDDWEAAKPTIPLLNGLAHPTHGARLRQLLAKNRTSPKVLASARWHLVQAGAGARFEAVLSDLQAQMQAAEALLDNPPVLAEVRGELEEWSRGVIDALAEYANDPAPRRWLLR